MMAASATEREYWAYNMDKVFAKRLLLRKIEEKDLLKITEWSNSAEACGKYLSQEHFTPEECYERFCNSYFWNRESKTYVIELKTNQTIGIIRYWVKPEDESTVMVSVKIACPDLRRKGFGTEAQIILIKHLFDIRGFLKIEMYTDIDNGPQQTCLDKLGFDFVETVAYPDIDTVRTGKRYELTAKQYKILPIYKYYFETCRDHSRQ